jgi:hypothetical protein
LTAYFIARRSQSSLYLKILCCDFGGFDVSPKNGVLSCWLSGELWAMKGWDFRVLFEVSVLLKHLTRSHEDNISLVRYSGSLCQICSGSKFCLHLSSMFVCTHPFVDVSTNAIEDRLFQLGKFLPIYWMIGAAPTFDPLTLELPIDHEPVFFIQWRWQEPLSTRSKSKLLTHFGSCFTYSYQPYAQNLNFSSKCRMM